MPKICFIINLFCTSCGDNEEPCGSKYSIFLSVLLIIIILKWPNESELRKIEKGKIIKLIEKIKIF